MLNERIPSLSKLRPVLMKTEDILTKLPKDTPYSDFELKLRELGLEKGWGNTAGRVLESIHMLLDLVQAPDPETLEKFLARMPLMFSVVIMSPHGYFGQEGVLGMPDTGGQVKPLFQNCQLQIIMKNLCTVLAMQMMMTMNPPLYNQLPETNHKCEPVR
jgi:sucrose synthase